MSIHLVNRAAEVQGLRPAAKLVLLALAENARDPMARIASPGVEVLSTWSGLARASVYECLAELLEAGHITRLGGGYRGRRAEFRVLPAGCCEEHAEGSGPPDSVKGPEARTLQGKGPVKGPAEQTQEGPKGPAGGVKASARPDPFRRPSVEDRALPPTSAGGLEPQLADAPLGTSRDQWHRLFIRERDNLPASQRTNRALINRLAAQALIEEASQVRAAVSA